MSQSTIQCNEIAPGILIQEGVRFSPKVAESWFGPLIGKTISKIVIHDSESSNEPQVVLKFKQGGAALILSDAEGNGPGFIEYHAD
jgi:hypothetical protein